MGLADALALSGEIHVDREAAMKRRRLVASENSPQPMAKAFLTIEAVAGHQRSPCNEFLSGRRQHIFLVN
jgi:hypothetical protein